MFPFSFIPSPPLQLLLRSHDAPYSPHHEQQTERGPGGGGDGSVFKVLAE